MRELSVLVSMAFACLFAAVAVGGVIPPSKTAPAPVAQVREPVPYCRADERMAVPEMGPGRVILKFAPCEHMKEERDA